MEHIEAILLTGGASRRMGHDKAQLPVDGEPLGVRIARILTDLGIPVTVLGREPLEGFGFLRDAKDFDGPLSAIARFEPSNPFVFVCSCDIPGFSGDLVPHLRAEIGDSEAAIPIAGDRRQPLCGLYRATALAMACTVSKTGEKRIMGWIDKLKVQVVALEDESWVANVNTPDEWDRT